MLSNVAYQVKPNTQHEQQKQPVRKVVKKSKRKISVGEKFVYTGTLALMLFGAVQMISNQATLYSTNAEVQALESNIQQQETKNNELKLQVTELSAYERIWAKAKELGLSLNENNVKVVEN
ncbi:cell division protein FtsL [Priestia flexa]|uniref:cell division protein FtsL n=1 Tax=Priestia TaxID=2800373 RepID=UPI0026CCCB40|nr:cell division protein FtsL [Priestia flexa]MDT2045698.1 cell division protein FtsL [Priestia flexa]